MTPYGVRRDHNDDARDHRRSRSTASKIYRTGKRRARRDADRQLEHDVNDALVPA